MPGWPEVPDAHFRSTDVAGRRIIGLEDSQFNIDIGGLRGYDYFGDGSFYLLDAPGVRIYLLPARPVYNMALNGSSSMLLGI